MGVIAPATASGFQDRNSLYQPYKKVLRFKSKNCCLFPYKFRRWFGCRLETLVQNERSLQRRSRFLQRWLVCHGGGSRHGSGVVR